MKYRDLGGSDIKISAVGLGCMGMTHAYGAPSDETEMIKLIRSARRQDLSYQRRSKPIFYDVPRL